MGVGTTGSGRVRWLRSQPTPSAPWRRAQVRRRLVPTAPIHLDGSPRRSTKALSRIASRRACQVMTGSFLAAPALPTVLLHVTTLRDSAPAPWPAPADYKTQT